MKGCPWVNSQSSHSFDSKIFTRLVWVFKESNPKVLIIPLMISPQDFDQGLGWVFKSQSIKFSSMSIHNSSPKAFDQGLGSMLRVNSQVFHP